MNITKLLPNDHTKVWIIDPHIDGRKTYGIRTGVAKVIRNLESIKIILKEMITVYPGRDSLLLNNFEVGNSIYITYCEVGNPSIFENNDPILILKNCKFRRSWITNLVALNSNNVRYIEMFLIAESWDFEWRGE